MKHFTTIRRILIPSEVCGDPVLTEASRQANYHNAKRKINPGRVLEHGRPTWTPGER